jgi:hypothetical protein
VLHLIDRYLLPVPYQYYFEPQKLDILSHFDRNETYQRLEQALSEASPPVHVDVDDRVQHALARCPLQRGRRPSFLARQTRKAAAWLRMAHGRDA